MGSLRSGGGAGGGSSGPSVATPWVPGIYVVQNQLVFESGTLYRTLTAHTTRATFDATEQTYFAPVTGSDQIEPGASVDMTGTITVDANAEDFVVYQGRLTGNTHLATTGYLATPSRYTTMWFLIAQDPTGGRTFTFDDTIVWDGGGYPPVTPTPASGAFQFMLYSLDGGVTKRGAHFQPVRTHTVRIGATLTDAMVGKDLEYFGFDARIVKVRPSCGGPPVSTAAVFDLNKGAGDGVASTVYSTQANRPSVAATKRTNAATVLPDTVLIAPNDYLTGDCDTASGATNGALAVKTIEAAV